jgi:hypothetical protein
MQPTSRSVHFEILSPPPFRAARFLWFVPRLPAVLYRSVKTSGRIAIADVMPGAFVISPFSSFQIIAPVLATIVKPVFQAILVELETPALYSSAPAMGSWGLRLHLVDRRNSRQEPVFLH